jgi:hypothetical protein
VEPEVETSIPRPEFMRPGGLVSWGAPSCSSALRETGANFCPTESAPAARGGKRAEPLPQRPEGFGDRPRG